MRKRHSIYISGAAAGDSDNEDDQEAVDMEAFIESGMLDSATVDVDKKSKNVSNKKSESGGGGGEIENVRTYDLNITYDKFYQTPRLWLFGYDESRKALSVDEMYEDFSAGSICQQDFVFVI